MGVLPYSVQKGPETSGPFFCAGVHPALRGKADPLHMVSRHGGRDKAAPSLRRAVIPAEAGIYSANHLEMRRRRTGFPLPRE